MTIAEQVTRAKADYDEVYAAGKQAEYDNFWDNLQNYGNRRSYRYAFYSYAVNNANIWNDSNFNPKYDFKITGINEFAYAFRAVNITDIKKTVYAEGATLNNTFAMNYQLKTIPKLVVSADTLFTNTFTNDTALENITFEGTIGTDLNLQWCPLTVASMKNIISCLANYAGTDNANKYTLTINDDCWAALEADSTAPTGTSWAEYVASLGWIT